VEESGNQLLMRWNDEMAVGGFVHEAEGEGELDCEVNAVAKDESGNAKLRTFRSGAIYATVWRANSGQARRSDFGVSIQKRLRIGPGGWKTVKTINFGDLPHLVAVAKEVYSFIDCLLRPDGMTCPLVVKEIPAETEREGAEPLRG